MDVSPIQRMAMQASEVVKPAPDVPRTRAIAPVAQAQPVSADQDVTTGGPGAQLGTHVVVAWHAASLGYVTSVVDQHTGEVLYQSPPEEVLNMVEQIIEKLEGNT